MEPSAYVGRSSLSADLNRETAQRLQILSVTVVVVLLVTALIEHVVVPLVQGQVPALQEPQSHLFQPIALLVSIGVFFFARYRPEDPRLGRVGLVYFLVVALALAVDNTHEIWLNQTPPNRVTGMAIWILVYPMIVPNPPRRTLVASLVAAALSPLTAAVWRYLQTGVVSSPAIVLFWIADFIAAGLAVIPALVIEKLRRKVREAREMGSYRLIEKIGSGGMGEVWRADHHLLARPAAIKIIRPDALGSRDDEQTRVTLGRFEREARATAQLASPFSIEVYDFGMTEDGTFYYVMELLDGFDFSSLVEKFGPLPPGRVIYLLDQACHSLEDAHRRGLMHRDVKPANLFNCRRGQDVDFVKVLDFGLVRQIVEPQDERITMANMATGTPAFMAPEQAMADPRMDHRVDLYALGCVGYWLLTGQLVFDAKNYIEMITKHTSDLPVPPSRRTTREVPPDLEAVILLCLEKEPAQRPQTADELARRLRSCRDAGSWQQESARDWWDRYASASV